KDVFLGVWREESSLTHPLMHQFCAYAGARRLKMGRLWVAGVWLSEGILDQGAAGRTIGRMMLAVTGSDMAREVPSAAIHSTVKLRAPRGTSRTRILVDVDSSSSSPSMK